MRDLLLEINGDLNVFKFDLTYNNCRILLFLLSENEREELLWEREYIRSQLYKIISLQEKNAKIHKKILVFQKNEINFVNN